MSGHGGGHGGSDWGPLKKIGLVVVGVWIIWYFSGGPERAAKQGDMPFINSPQSVENGFQNGQVYDINGNSINSNQ